MGPKLKFLDMKDRTANNKPKGFESTEYTISSKKNPKTGRTTWMAIAKSPKGNKCYRFVSEDFASKNK